MLKLITAGIQMLMVLTFYATFTTFFHILLFISIENKPPPVLVFWFLGIAISAMICIPAKSAWPLSWIPGAAAVNLLVISIWAAEFPAWHLPDILFWFSIMLFTLQGLIILYAWHICWENA